jgi:internalin A
MAFESKGIKAFPEPVNGDVLELNVQELLDAVELEGAREPEPAHDRPIRLFYSYAHKDEYLRDQLQTHLKILERRKLITVWHDRKIMAGGEWGGEIDDNLERAHIILLLVSADFIASDYCWDKEVKRALERHDAREATVIPVIVRDVNWDDAPFAKLQALPRDAKPVTKWTNRDSAWKSVSKGIERAAKKIRQKGHP